MAVAALAAMGHLLGWPPLDDLVSVPVAGLVAMCLMGVTARLIPARRRGLVAMVPERLPSPGAVVWLTGVCELAGGAGVLITPLRPMAAGCLAVFLVCVFPANIRRAHQQGDADGTFPRRILVRGGEQAVFLALCGWAVTATVH
jgi:uncharacterized membrane protein